MDPIERRGQGRTAPRRPPLGCFGVHFPGRASSVISTAHKDAASICPLMINSHDRSSEFAAEASATDVLSDMLRSVRLTGSMLFLVDASKPWVSWAPQTESFRDVV